jgi:hypothetical protein
MKPRIYADFQKLDDEGRAMLTCVGSLRDIHDQNLVLRHGESVVLYSDDLDDNNHLDELQVDAVLEWIELDNHWVGRFDPATFRHESDEK